MLQNIIAKAVETLKSGGLVGLPTETVYGLAADAGNEDALRKIFLAKKRPIDHPVIVHIAEISQLDRWTKNIPDDALKLAKAFWPGSLTLILQKADKVSKIVTGGQDTIGVRIPNHPITLEILKKFSGGVAAPSANRFGHISPTTALAVKEELGEVIDLIVDGGQCKVGVESTIIDLSSNEPVILRPGMITQDQIERILNKKVLLKQKDSPRVSGSLDSHYAPTTKTKLLNKKDLLAYVEGSSDSLALLLLGSDLFIDKSNAKSFYMSQNPHNYAKDLYKTLREIDKQNFQEILIEDVPDDLSWHGVRDRITRASSSS